MLPLLLALTLVHASPQTGFEFGRVGGNIIPFTVTISASGAVTRKGPAPGTATHLSRRQLAALSRVATDVRFSRLPAVTACPNTLPDVAAQFIRVAGRTVRVHGSCIARFNRLWAALTKATR
jgi:hypothetical protein